MHFYIKAIFPLLLCIGLLSCGKDKDPGPVNPPVKFIFDLKGTRNFNLESSAGDSMTVSITRVSGVSEKITLAMAGLPENMTATITPKEGLPPFTAKIILKGNNVPVGTYNATLNATGATAGTVPFPVTITTFKEDIACIPGLLGVYSISEECEGSPVAPYNATVEADPSNPKGIVINKFAALDIAVKASVVCGSSTFVIPKQTIGIHTVSGTATFSGNKLKIDYDLTSKDAGSTTFTASCTATYLRR